MTPRERVYRLWTVVDQRGPILVGNVPFLARTRRKAEDFRQTWSELRANGSVQRVTLTLEAKSKIRKGATGAKRG